MNPELRPPAVNSVKRGKVLVIQTLDKVDSAVRPADPSTRDNFPPYKRVMICINVSIFFRIFQNIGWSTRTQRSKFGRSFPHFGRNRWLVVILSSVTRCGRKNMQCVLLGIEYVK